MKVITKARVNTGGMFDIDLASEQQVVGTRDNAELKDIDLDSRSLDDGDSITLESQATERDTESIDKNKLSLILTFGLRRKPRDAPTSKAPPQKRHLKSCDTSHDSDSDPKQDIHIHTESHNEECFYSISNNNITQPTRF